MRAEICHFHSSRSYRLSKFDMRHYSRTLTIASSPVQRFSGRVYTGPIVALYIYAYIYIYINWAAPNYYYIGFQYQYDPLSIAFACVLAAAVFVCLAQRVSEYSQFFAWMIYLTLYVPSVLSIAMQGFYSFSSYVLNSAITISFLSLLFLPQIIRQNKINQIRSSAVFWYFLPLYIMALSFYLYSYGDVMSMPTFGDIYDQRAAFSSVKAGGLASYLTSWLSTALNPYLIAIGLFDRSKRWALPLGLLGQIAVFMGFAGKIMLAVTVVIILFAVFVIKDDEIRINRLVASAAALILIPLAVIYITNYDPTGLNPGGCGAHIHENACDTGRDDRRLRRCIFKFSFHLLVPREHC